MPSLHDFLPTRSGLLAAHVPLIAFAAVVAMVLLSFYVHLLHESMALGDQLRERQRSASSSGPLKAVAQRAPPRASPDRAGRYQGAKP